jgi:hypothetical protein
MPTSVVGPMLNNVVLAAFANLSVVVDIPFPTMEMGFASMVRVVEMRYVPAGIKSTPPPEGMAVRALANAAVSSVTPSPLAP